jgi:hypothetical protein
MKFKLLWIIGAILLLTSCSAKLTSSLLRTYPPLHYLDEVRVFSINETVPSNAEKLGTIKIGDSGFSTNCKYSTVIDMAKIEARKVGGNALKITQHKQPDLWSTCHRISANVFRIDSIENYIAKPEPIDSAMLAANYAIINVYRPSGTGFLVGYNLNLGDSVICRVKDDFCQSIKIYKDGYNTLWAKTEAKVEVPIKIEFGRIYYVRCGIDMGAFVGHPSIELLDYSTGKEEFTAMEKRKQRNN